MKSLLFKEATEKDLLSILSLYSQPDMDDGRVLPLKKAKELFKKVKSYPDYKILFTLLLF